MMKNEMVTNAKFMSSYWVNLHNTNLYRNMPISYFRKQAIEGGLDDGCDVKAITKYIKNAESILETGAGYGRVLNCIINNGFKGKLVALEREPKLYRVLKRKFKQVQVICDDIRSVKFERKFDLILWLWTGLWEFSQPEQTAALTNLFACLNNGGCLIVDLIPITCKTIRATSLNKSNRVISTPYGNDYLYLPSHVEMKRYSRQLNSKMKMVTYKTKTGKTKNLYIFRKIANTNTASKKRAISRK